MWKPRAAPHSLLELLVLCLVLALVSAQRSKKTEWNTLSGNPPLVIARGGFSGMFPDSSYAAYSVAKATSIDNFVAWCDVQLTKDATGICIPYINLENATSIAAAFQNKSKTYLVNGEPISGYFSVDYTFKDLQSNVILVQGVYSRTSSFDGNIYTILTVEEVVKDAKPPGLWLNIQHNAFYTQHNLSMRNFVLDVSKRVVVNYISSPEAGFLRSLSGRVSRTTKLVFRIMGTDDVDPSTNQTYGSLLKNLTSIKLFASGILVSKGSIWPVDSSLYLLPHTTLVSDAHKVGLEVFASDFVSDVPFSYNYSYDPLAEYLQFIDNGDFSVDGVLSDFPITPSEAVDVESSYINGQAALLTWAPMLQRKVHDCFLMFNGHEFSLFLLVLFFLFHCIISVLTRLASLLICCFQFSHASVNTIVISKYGASGDYPGCTDLAYETAIKDGVDVLDCPVQMSNDGIPFCLSSIDLIESTAVAQSSFSRFAKAIPELKSGSGIFTFSLTWSDIQTLTPSISSPYAKYKLFRNPKYNKNVKFLTLSDFLNLTKSQASLSGVMIIVENAGYLAKEQNLSVTEAIIKTLSKAGYDKPGAPKVMIQSTNSSVLLKFKEKTNYELVYKIDEQIGDAVDAAIKDIKGFAHSVVLTKQSVLPKDSGFFLTGPTKIVPKLKSSNLSVYVEIFSNEFVSQAWDFFSDATVEINTYVQEEEIDGVITDFPKTADRYRRNKCLNMGSRTPNFMLPVEIGGLLGAIQAKEYLPPAAAPLPPLTESEVREPPLPSTSTVAPSSSPTAPGNGSVAQPPKNAETRVTVCFFLSTLAVLLGSLLL